MTAEIYPMPSFPMLIVHDLQASTHFYQELLGFEHIFTMPGPGGTPALVHLRWAKYADLLIARPREGREPAEPVGNGVSLNYNFSARFEGGAVAPGDEPAQSLLEFDRFAARARQAGARVSGPLDRPWNVREVTLLDPDGYKLVFTVPLDTGLGFNQLLERATGDQAAE